METQKASRRINQRKLAQRFLVLICTMFSVLLLVFAFFPAVLHMPVIGESISLGLPVGFGFILFIFFVMIVYVRSQGK